MSCTMPTLRHCSVSSDGNNIDGAPAATQSDDANNNEPTSPSNSPSKSKESNISPTTTASESNLPAKNPAADPPLFTHKRPPSTLSTASSIIISPSPHQVMSDLIDATCHEIILLEGTDPESIAPFPSYAVLIQRLDYYMEQLDRDQNQEAEDDNVDNGQNNSPLLKDSNIRCRLGMATLAIDMCSRLAYPVEFVDTSKIMHPPCSNLPALIHLPTSKWYELRQELGKLAGMVAEIRGGEEKETVLVDPLFESLNCQMEAMEALAKLRNQLLSVITEINKEENDKKSASHYSYVGNHLEEYKIHSEVINGKLRNIHQTNHFDLFVPDQMLSSKRCSTIDRVKNSVTSLIEGVDDMVNKKVFPLKLLQVQLLSLLKNWEESHLSLPSLVKAGYFKHGDASSDPRPMAAATTAKSAMYSGRGRSRKTDKKMPPRENNEEIDSDDDELSLVVKRKTTSKPRSHPRRAARSGYQKRNSPPRKAKMQPKRYDSDLDMSDKPSPKKHTKRSPRKRPPSLDSFMSDSQSPTQNPKKKKRIPYSEEEKGALLMGVEKIGIGRWNDILDYYQDVFKVNNRTNVNLKDLYRNLTK
ncbi:hypothetical protein ACHAXR_011227 [Thalassiosira sp. AJA248-18]